MTDHHASAEPQLADTTTSFGPTRGAVIGTLAAGFVFAVVLEFLVIISFIGQKLWKDPRLGQDLWFTLPLLIWVVVAVTATAITLRIITRWVRLHPGGISVNGLLSRQRRIPWSEVEKVLLIHRITRGNAALEVLDRGDEAFDTVVLLGSEGSRLASVPSRFYNHRAQEAVVGAAAEAGVEITEIHEIGTRELRAIAPHSLPLLDAHPKLMLLAGVLFYLGHNVLTFIIWGL